MTGIICLDKPRDMTSFMAVKRASRILGVKKAGHTGTLDPMATGVLVIMFGHCTRFIELLPEHRKSYSARVGVLSATDVRTYFKSVPGTDLGMMRQVPSTSCSILQSCSGAPVSVSCSIARRDSLRPPVRQSRQGC